MKSWKTTTLGILTILSTLSNAALEYFSTGKLPDWTLLIGGLTAGAGLIAARDNNVTSEQANAK